MPLPNQNTGLVTATPSAGSGLVSATPSNSGLLVQSSSTPNPNAVLPGSDFTILSTPKRKGVFLVFGPEGVGKTTWALRYAPDPVALIGFDGRSEYVEAQQKELGRTVMSVQITPPQVLIKSDDVRKSATEVLQKVLRNFNTAIAASKQGKVRTIVLDTGSELGEIITLSQRGTLDPTATKDFGRSKDQINTIWKGIFAMARFVGDAHLVVLGRASEIWEGNSPTGEFRPRVHDVVKEAVDYALHIRLGRERVMLPAAGTVSATPTGLVPAVGLISTGGSGSAGGRAPAKEVQVQVTKAGNNLAELGSIYTEKDWGELGPFVYSCLQLMPGSVADDWR